METESDVEDFLVAFMARSSHSATPRRWREGSPQSTLCAMGSCLNEPSQVSTLPTSLPPRYCLSCLSSILSALLHHLCRALSLLRRLLLFSLSSSAAPLSPPPSPPSSLFSF
ncbi:hypothetical protein Syun_006878 [Stephania yunnanensis]|uniref:Uncharacterized protein n=1 Tax=Stephania yunnanensis TaxID=152371 RepID=A0AAP0PXZ1_9MAGN